MNPLEILAWLVLIGAIMTLVFGLLMVVDVDFFILALISGGITFVGFIIYLILWVIAKAVGAI
jgi:hypothetical protein